MGHAQAWHHGRTRFVPPRNIRKLVFPVALWGGGVVSVLPLALTLTTSRQRRGPPRTQWEALQGKDPTCRPASAFHRILGLAVLTRAQGSPWPRGHRTWIQIPALPCSHSVILSSYVTLLGLRFFIGHFGLILLDHLGRFL